MLASVCGLKALLAAGPAAGRLLTRCPNRGPICNGGGGGPRRPVVGVKRGYLETHTTWFLCPPEPRRVACPARGRTNFCAAPTPRATYTPFNARSVAVSAPLPRPYGTASGAAMLSRWSFVASAACRPAARRVAKWPSYALSHASAPWGVIQRRRGITLAWPRDMSTKLMCGGWARATLRFRSAREQPRRTRGHGLQLGSVPCSMS
eukprot:363114-Chlamydomonas_euryale.AAC.1